MFSCDACGICCRHIRGIKELERFMLDDGSCVNLDKMSNLCKIYEARPQICRIDEMYEAKFKRYFSKEAFYELNENACKKLKEIYKG